MFLFILLILINNKNLIKTNQLQVYYVRENIEVPGSFNGNLISSSKQQSRLSCLILCYLRSDCITLVYDEKSMNLRIAKSTTFLECFHSFRTPLNKTLDLARLVEYLTN